MNVRNDTTKNYTASENMPGGARIPEFALRQLIRFALKQLAEQAQNPGVNIIDELFALHDQEVRDQIKAYLRDHQNIQVVVNYPRPDMHLPLIACVNGSENDDPQVALLGDISGSQVMGGGGARTQRLTVQRSVTHIYVMSDDPNLTLFLGVIVRFIIFANAFELTEFYDLHNISLGMQDVQWDERLFPSFCFVRAVTVNCQTVFDYNLPEEVNKIISVSLMVATQTDPGIELITRVPPEDAE